MGVPPGEPLYARDRDGADLGDDPGRAQARRRRRAWLGGALALAAWPLAAETVRLGVYHTDLGRDGPGLLLRDIWKGDPQISALARVVAHADPDVLLLLDVDWDAGGAALGALAQLMDYPYSFAARPNSGWPSGLDLDGDGRLGGPGDAYGYGAFSGSGGMALLSRYPLPAAAEDFSRNLWRDLPGAVLPELDGPFPSAEAWEVMRLASVAHWSVPVTIGATELHLGLFHATTPVFDGPEDRNGLRNRDELRFWHSYAQTAPAPFVLMGDANLDPADGAGHRDAIQALLAHPRLTDPEPRRDGPAVQDPNQTGDPALDTVDWPEAEGPGDLRVSYILPDVSLTVTGAGVLWDGHGSLPRDIQTASRHRLVWVDLRLER